MITDSVPEERVGVVMVRVERFLVPFLPRSFAHALVDKQGWIMIGFSVGQLIGPPVGGVLYERLGYKAPFVFALILGEYGSRPLSRSYFHRTRDSPSRRTHPPFTPF